MVTAATVVIAFCLGAALGSGARAQEEGTAQQQQQRRAFKGARRPLQAQQRRVFQGERRPFVRPRPFLGARPLAEVGPIAATRPFAGATTAASSGQPALAYDLLQRMVRADNSVPYEARETTFGSGRTVEETVKFDPAHGERRESTHPPGEVYVDDFQHSWLLSDRNRNLIQRPSMIASDDETNALARIRIGRSVAEWVGEEMVAGRIADIVSVHAVVRPGRAVASRRYWIDRETGLRLRSEDRGPGGRILSDAYYLSIDLHPQFAPSDFTPPVAPSGYAAVVERRQSYKSYEEAAGAGIVVRRPGYLPEGVRLQGIEVINRDAVQPDRAGAVPVQRIMQRFDDGPFLLTLTQTNGLAVPRRLQPLLDASGAGFLPLPRGQRGYVWHLSDAPGETFIIIGSIPDDEMKRIADSVR